MPRQSRIVTEYFLLSGIRDAKDKYAYTVQEVTIRDMLLLEYWVLQYTISNATHLRSNFEVLKAPAVSIFQPPTAIESKMRGLADIPYVARIPAQCLWKLPWTSPAWWKRHFCTCRAGCLGPKIHTRTLGKPPIIQHISHGKSLTLKNIKLRPTRCQLSADIRANLALSFRYLSKISPAINPILSKNIPRWFF